ncbi:GNAT family N-acetyltransferase [Salmonella enterica subsp. enterica serovar Kingston]|nr:GNAT family N-acetyltransferase [Salmonella enterica subsp. enterica serovar Kingston]
MDAGFILPQEKQQILDEINGWLNTVYPYKKPPAHLCDPIDRTSKSFRIDARRKKFSIYLRLGKTWASSQNKSIVIAQIRFEKERSGYGSALLRVLSLIAQKYNYKIIAIESVNDDSRAFALNFRFSERQGNDNYIITTEKLTTILNKPHKSTRIFE